MEARVQNPPIFFRSGAERWSDFSCIIRFIYKIMDPIAPLSTEEFDIFEFLCQMKEEFFVSQAAGGVVLLSFLISIAVTWCRAKKMKKKYKIERTQRYNTIIVTDDEEPFPPHPNLTPIVPRSSTPQPRDTWV
jgi:hypothetical protein